MQPSWIGGAAALAAPGAGAPSQVLHLQRHLLLGLLAADAQHDRRCQACRTLPAMVMPKAPSRSSTQLQEQFMNGRSLMKLRGDKGAKVQLPMITCIEIILFGPKKLPMKIFVLHGCCLNGRLRES